MELINKNNDTLKKNKEVNKKATNFITPDSVADDGQSEPKTSKWSLKALKIAMEK